MKVLSWEEICKIKDELQDKAIEAWIKKGARGCVEFFTGFGKTTTAIKCIERMRAKNPHSKVIVVVPTDDLLIQWKSKVANVEVYIINSYIKKQWECDLLILDEAHVVNANTFKAALVNSNYKWILGLTATFKRKDGKHEIMNEYAPIVYSVNLKEGEELGIVAKNQYINFNIKLDKEEEEEYDKINKSFNNLFAYFMHDMDCMHSCMNVRGAAIHNNRHPDLFPDFTHKERISKIAEYANLCNRYMQQRSSFVYNSATKIALCVDLVKALDLKTIIFGESNNVVDEISQRINLGRLEDIAKPYHSNNTKKENKAYYDMFKRGIIKYLVSARKLIVGVDEPDICLGIDFSYTSSLIDSQQKRGRILRIDKNNLNKVALYINFVIKDTIEEKWSTSKNKGINRMINVESVEEIVSIYEKLKISQ